MVLPHAPKERALLVGVGNIGSQLAPLAAPVFGFVRLVDRDVVEPHNVENQSYFPSDVGRPKVDVIADRLAQAYPHLEIERFAGDLQDLPLGKIADVDVALAGLDSLSARQALGEAVYPLGIPYIDGAVGEPYDVRVQVLLPDSACLECSWGNAHYRQLHTEKPCREPERSSGPRTLAPALTGAATASLMVAQCNAVLGDEPPDESYEIHGDLGVGRVVKSRRRRNSDCRFDHWQVVQTHRLDTPFEWATVNDLLAAVAKLGGDGAATLEFRRGIIEPGLFQEDRLATVEQLHDKRSVSLAEMGLTIFDHVVLRQATDGKLQTIHITLDG